jgi:hypothetical protein
MLATPPTHRRAPARPVTIDPYPSPLIEPLDTELRAARGSEVPLEESEALGDGDRWHWSEQYLLP